MRRHELSTGPIDVTDVGSGPPVVLLHGYLLDGSFWDGVASRLADSGHRVLVPTLPLGSHRDPVRPGTDLTPPGLADLIAELLDRLAEGVGTGPLPVVTNDTSTALVQILLARHPHAVSGALLSTGDAYDVFLPKEFLPLVTAARFLPGALRVVPMLARFGALRRLRWVHGWLTEGGSTAYQAERWLGRLRDPGVRRDAAAVAAGISTQHTQAAARRLGEVDVPVTVLWGDADRLFPLRLGERLAADLPRAELRVVPARTTYLPIDQPALFAEEVRRFLARLPGREAGPGQGTTEAPSGQG